MGPRPRRPGAAAAPDLSWSDAWIFASIADDPAGDGANLTDIVARADVLNHAIPTVRELVPAFERLFERGLIAVDGKTIRLTDYGRRVQENGRARRGGLFSIVDNMHAALRSPRLAPDPPLSPVRPRSSHALPRFWFVNTRSLAEACDEYTSRSGSKRL